MDEPLQRKFSYLFSNVVKKECTIHELYSTRILEIQFEKSLSQELQIQKQQLKRALTRVSLQNQKQNHIQWNKSIQGFSIKLIYKFLQSAPLYKIRISSI
jgi:hypothetical protein